MSAPEETEDEMLTRRKAEVEASLKRVLRSAHRETILRRWIDAPYSALPFIEAELLSRPTGDD
jgi:hypothetical protein